MNLTLFSGTFIVTIALISYSIAILTEQMKHTINKIVVFFLTMGLVMDIAATILMIAGSKNIPFTFHGLLGYSALATMLLDTILIWKIYLRNAINPEVPRNVHLYSRYAYVWWVVAYITGGIMASMKF